MVCHQDTLLSKYGICVDRGSKPCHIAKYFFLTHAHGDHTVGLFSKQNEQKDVYCSYITAKILPKHNLHIHTMKMDKEYRLENGVSVWAIPSYHVDGSCMFLFHIENQRILFTGDFRFNQCFLNHKLLTSGKIDKVYYDDSFSKIDIDLPTTQDSYRTFSKAMHELENSAVVIRINMSSMGFEPILRKFSQHTGCNYALSDCFKDVYRGHQIRQLMGKHIHARSRVILSHRDHDDRSQGAWIMPSATYFLQKDKVMDEHPCVRVFHATHSNREEVQRFLNLVGAKENIACLDLIKM